MGALLRHIWPAVASLWLGVAAGAVNAADWFVATTGSDSNSGSETRPLRTISRALTLAADGDRVLLMAGDYDFPTPPPKNRTSDYVTVMPAPGHAGAVRLNGYIRPYSNHDYLRFQNLDFKVGVDFRGVTGFQVRGCTAAGHSTLYGIHGAGADILIEGNVVYGGAKAYVFSGTNVVVRWNEAYHTTSDGFFCGSGSNILFEGNYFHDNTPEQGAHPDFFQFYGGNPGSLRGLTVRRNYFDTAGQGLFGQRYGGIIEDVLVENNVIISTHARAWSFETTDNVTCRNNTFCFPPEQGTADPSGGGSIIYMDAWGGGPYMYANNMSRYLGRPSNPALAVRNSLLFEYALADPGCMGPVSPYAVFRDFDAHDFRLKPGSPAINAGAAAAAPADDILGRPRDAAPDIGAYEYNPADAQSLRDMFVAMLEAKRAEIRGETAPPPTGVLEVTGATVSPDWAYQNTASTTLDRHCGLLTVSVNDTWGNAAYTVTVTRTAGPGEVTVAAGSGDLQKKLVGSRRTDGAAGAGTCRFSVRVVGDVGGDATAPVATTFKVRRLGDVNDDGSVNTDDSVQLTKRLNGLNVAPLGTRDFDVTGDGLVTTDDDVLLAKLLNNLAIP